MTSSIGAIDLGQWLEGATGTSLAEGRETQFLTLYCGTGLIIFLEFCLCAHLFLNLKILLGKKADIHVHIHLYVYLCIYKMKLNKQ